MGSTVLRDLKLSNGMLYVRTVAASGGAGRKGSRKAAGSWSLAAQAYGRMGANLPSRSNNRKRYREHGKGRPTVPSPASVSQSDNGIKFAAECPSTQPVPFAFSRRLILAAVP